MVTEKHASQGITEHSFQIILIGIGPQGPASLKNHLKDSLAEAKELWAPQDLLEIFPLVPIRRKLIINDLRKRFSRLSAIDGDSAEIIHVLCYGDPGLNGLTSLIQSFCPSDELKIYPNIDPLQEAFSLLKSPWQRTTVYNTALTSLPKIYEQIQYHSPVAVYTTEDIPASRFLKGIRQEKIANTKRVVILWPGQDEWSHNLSWDPSSKSAHQSLPASCLFLFISDEEDLSEEDSQLFSLAKIPDESLETCEGVFSDQSLRSLIFAKLAPLPNDTIWDIGAGEGAFSIACAQGIEQHRGQGNVQAIEWERPYFSCFLKNITQHSSNRLKLFQGQPEAILSQLSNPDTILIQERTQHIEKLIPLILKRTKGKIKFLIKATSFSQTTQITQIFEKHLLDVEVSMVPQQREVNGYDDDAETSFLCLILAKRKGVKG